MKKMRLISGIKKISFYLLILIAGFAVGISYANHILNLFLRFPKVQIVILFVLTIFFSSVLLYLLWRLRCHDFKTVSIWTFVITASVICLGIFFGKYLPGAFGVYRTFPIRINSIDETIKIIEITADGKKIPFSSFYATGKWEKSPSGMVSIQKDKAALSRVVDGNINLIEVKFATGPDMGKAEFVFLDHNEIVNLNQPVVGEKKITKMVYDEVFALFFYTIIPLYADIFTLFIFVYLIFPVNKSARIYICLFVWMVGTILIYNILFSPPELWAIAEKTGFSTFLLQIKDYLQPFLTAPRG